MLKPPDQVLKKWDKSFSDYYEGMTPNTQKRLLSSMFILTNNPDRYQSGVFCNDLSDHCFTACVRNGCSGKRPVLICHRRLLKNFNEQAFLHDLASAKWYRISLIPSVEDAWTLFFYIFSGIVNKHTHDLAFGERLGTHAHSG
jgi:hypothetical protein